MCCASPCDPDVHLGYCKFYWNFSVLVNDLWIVYKMDMMCIILCFYFVGGCILKWVLNREKTLFTTSSEHIITDTLPGNLIMHDRSLNNKGNLSYSVKQLLTWRERTLHHRIYMSQLTLESSWVLNSTS